MLPSDEAFTKQHSSHSYWIPRAAYQSLDCQGITTGDVDQLICSHSEVVKCRSRPLDTQQNFVRDQFSQLALLTCLFTHTLMQECEWVSVM